jgi:tail length tape measure protein
MADDVEVRISADASGFKVAMSESRVGAQSLIDSFARLKKQTAESEKGFASAQSEVKRLAVELKAAREAADFTGGAKGIRALEKDFDAAVRAAGRAKTEFLSQRDATEGLRRQLAGVGVSTSNLAAEQVKLRSASAATTGEVAKTGTALTRTGKSAKELELAMRGVPAQFTDIFTSLAAGQNPLMVFLQQGGQLKDMFGGIGPAARAVGGQILALVNPYTLTAASVAGLTAAYLAGKKEVSEFTRAILLSGNAAGTSVAQLQALSVQVEAASGATRGKAAEVLTTLVSKGKVAAGSLGEVAEAAIAMEVSAQSIEETAKQYASLGKAPLEAAMKINESTGFLTAATYQQIKALAEEGRTADATAVAQKALAEAQKAAAKQIEENLPPLEKGWNAVTEAIKHAADAYKNFGRDAPLEQQVESLRKRIPELLNVYGSGLLGQLVLKNAQEDLKTLEEKLAIQRKTNEERKTENDLTKATVALDQATATAKDEALSKQITAVNTAREAYNATIAALRQKNPDVDPLSTKQGIEAAEKLRAKIAEWAPEINKASIAAEGRLKEALVGAMQAGREEADKLKQDIKDLLAEAAQVRAGLSGAGLKAQERRDRAPTSEEADLKAQQQAIKDADRAGNKELAERLKLELDGKEAAAEAFRQRREDAIDARNAAEAEAAIAESSRAAVFAANAAIDAKSTGDVDRARAAQALAKQASDSAKAAEESASKIKDDGLAAGMLEQVQKVQADALDAQAAVKQAQLKEIEGQTAAQAKALEELETRVAALKSGTVVKIDVQSEAGLNAVKAFQAALDALPRNVVVGLQTQQGGVPAAPSGGGGDGTTTGASTPTGTALPPSVVPAQETVKVNADASQAAAAVDTAIPRPEDGNRQDGGGRCAHLQRQGKRRPARHPRQGLRRKTARPCPPRPCRQHAVLGNAREVVIQIPAVRHYGLDNLLRLNAMQLPKFAFGGQLGGVKLPSTSFTDRLPLAAMAQALEKSAPAGGLKPAVFKIDGFGEVPVHIDTRTEQELERLIDRRFQRAALSAGRRR